MSTLPRLPLAFLLALAALPASGSAASLALAPCKLPGLEREARCGTFEVWEDRAAARGRKIGLRVVLLPASGAERASDAMFYFEGGPGMSAVASAPDVAAEWAEINATRDVVLVDVRGTGLSNGLQCPTLQQKAGVLGFLESFLPVPDVEACRAAAEKRADLKLYTTALAVDDVDDVRAALGYERIDVGGGSYGSFAALTYLRRHPDHVRAVAVQGVVPPNARLPLQFARDAQLALDQVIAACNHEPACHAKFPDVAGDIARALARLEKEPAPATVRAANGERVEFKLSRNAAAQSLRYMLYSPMTAAQIPLQAHLAAAGDVSPLAETAYIFGGMMTDTSDGYYLSVTCTEDVPFFTDAEAAQAAKDTFLGEFRVHAQKAACAAWPRGDAADVNQPLRSNVPVLLISGERDPVTPARDAAAIAKDLPHALHIVVPGGAHGMAGLGAGTCLSGIVGRFIARGSEQGLDTSCIGKIAPLAFVLADTRAPEITLPAATLDHYAGTYTGDKGGELIVSRKGDHLEVSFGEGDANALTAVTPTRFSVNGLPPGFFVEFLLQGDAVTGVRLEAGPTDAHVLQRKKS